MQYAFSRTRQTGFTLVELMIGLTIGLLGVLSMISIYLAMARQVEGTSSEPGLRQRSTQDGQIALAIVTLQYDLQRAGFGINNPALHNDLIGVGTPVSALGWRWVNTTSNVTECAAMRYRATANVGATSETGVIEIIPLASPCPADPPSPTALFANSSLNIQTVASNVPTLVIGLTAAAPACYIGTDSATPGLRVTLQSRLSLGGLPTSADFCIFNIVS